MGLRARPIENLHVHPRTGSHGAIAVDTHCSRHVATQSSLDSDYGIGVI